MNFKKNDAKRIDSSRLGFKKSDVNLSSHLFLKSF